MEIVFNDLNASFINESQAKDDDLIGNEYYWNIDFIDDYNYLFRYSNDLFYCNLFLMEINFNFMVL
jgi:hypothetical protein